MQLDEKAAETLIALEQSLHEPATRGDRQQVAALLAEDFVEFGSSGRIFDKAQTISALAAETPSADERRLQAFDFVVTDLAQDVALVTYRIDRSHTRTGTVRTTLRSSIWKRINGRWQMLFHQGTVVPAV